MRLLPKRITIAAILLGVTLAGGVTGMLAGQALAGASERRGAEATPQGENGVSDGRLAGWVEKRVQEWEVTAAERRFDEIGWAKDIRDALRLAKKHGRPVFLFTHDGRMAIGRC